MFFASSDGRDDAPSFDMSRQKKAPEVPFLRQLGNEISDRDRGRHPDSPPGWWA
jgi:hypothetical protein